MLGYQLQELSHMINSVGIAYEAITSPEDIRTGLLKAEQFLKGLWAEGYFD